MPSAALQSADSFRKLYRDVSAQKQIATTDDHSASFLAVITGLAGHSIFVQKVQFSILVENNSEITLQSSNATPVPIVEINNPTTEGPNFWDFGERGVQIAEGESLNFRNSAAGMGLIVAVQAYMKPNTSLVAKTAGATSGYHTF